jgi:hypothetical protein
MNGQGRPGSRIAAAALLALAVAGCDAASSPDVPATTSTSTSASPSAPPVAIGLSLAGSRSYAAGDQLQMVVVAELTGDGFADIASANAGSDSISLLRGRGNGRFSQPVEQPSGVAHPTAITASDLNDDGTTDLVVANGEGPDGVAVLVNGGGGTFTAVPLPGGHDPQAVTTADLNRDGAVDVIAANGTGGVTSWSGAGDGSFGAPIDLPTDSTMCSWVTAADLNGDGAVDLVTANSRLGHGESDRSVSVLLGSGHGGFRAPVVYDDVGSQPTLVLVGDLNGDGTMDLVTPDGYPSTDDAVLLGNGDGSFEDPTHVTVGNNPHSGALADLDGDGVLDLVAGNLGTSFDLANPNGDVVVLPGLGDAAFGPPVSIQDSFPTFLTTADLNGDGLPDLVVADELVNSVAVTLNAAGG